MRGERRLLREGVLSVFDLLLQQSVLAKSEAVAAALAQQAELSLYLQHDLKNLTQWVLLVTDQFAAASDEQLPALARHLREHAPLARQRAERLVDQLSTPRQAHPEQDKPYDLLQEARIFASLHGLELKTPEQTLRVRLPKRAIERILDPLFASLANLDPPPEASLVVRCEGGWIQLEIRSSRAPALSLARLFEPRIRDQQGLPALGLYQSRTAALSLGGALTAQPRGEGMAYRLLLPES
jgi:hypothetical protein